MYVTGQHPTINKLIYSFLPCSDLICIHHHNLWSDSQALHDPKKCDFFCHCFHNKAMYGRCVKKSKMINDSKSGTAFDFWALAGIGVSKEEYIIFPTWTDPTWTVNII